MESGFEKCQFYSIHIREVKHQFLYTVDLVFRTGFLVTLPDPKPELSYSYVQLPRNGPSKPEGHWFHPRTPCWSLETRQEHATD